jgi:16S rRNA (cytidine1402-2'-O)-methyltransferase
LTLYLIATPIGNLGDLTQRAAETLKELDVILCEDTRRTGLLLHHLGLQKRMISFHEHNEDRKLPLALQWLRDGQKVGLVSDAGTPLISDPGFKLVREAAAENIPVIALPGASSVLVALVQSGLPPYPFTFLGYSPKTSGKRQRFYEQYRDLEHTTILFATPHALVNQLRELLNAWGDRPCCVCRELTKLHEENFRGTLSEALAHFEAKPSIKGELVIVIGKDVQTTANE